jgi:hypothetical protein
MPSNKRITDLTSYASVLPYDSELFGVYQPLLGWRSKRIEARLKKGFENDKSSALRSLINHIDGSVSVKYNENDGVEANTHLGTWKGLRKRNTGSLLMESLASRLPSPDRVNADVYKQILTGDIIQQALEAITKTYSESYSSFNTSDEAVSRMVRSREISSAESSRLKPEVFQRQLQYESAVAAALLMLVKRDNVNALNQLFFTGANKEEKIDTLARIAASDSPVDAFISISNINPSVREELQSVVLSPISVVHLFRQYFFELDSFLGTPVNHVWLSPGSTVEMVEIHTRKTVVEKTLETTLDIFNRSETTTTTQEEISDAIKENNQQDIKFGASVTASYSSIEATSSFDYNNSQQMARETVHKRMRQQSEKLSSEIRKNFKTTFKTVSELTDVSDIRHVMANNTKDLINYELRRKMRQVGVQVQDIGTFLCWQTYVDDPGSDLGISKLIHIAKSPDLDSIPQPEQIPTLQPFTEEKMITIPFISVANGADKSGEVYIDGVEQNNTEFNGDLEKIKCDFPQEFVSPKSNYLLRDIEFDPQGKPVEITRTGDIQNANDKASFMLHLRMADFKGQDSIEVKLVLHWAPSDAANEAIRQENEQKMKERTEREKAEYEKAYVENVRDRVNKASSIMTRKAEELREEERIVVYRKLIQDMLMNTLEQPDDRTRHVVAELINSIFDVDKMLYFVAPEWWRPRLHRSKQQVGETATGGRRFDPTVNAATIEPVRMARRNLTDLMVNIGVRFTNTPSAPHSNVLSASTVGWGGIDDNRRDNYWITEDSEPARLGSSLGWLLQLDGDNLRNAFLNAPWVKAVIPIRPGKEEAAINWLKGVEGMNGITDDVIYHASNPAEKDINGQPLEGQKMIDVLNDLAKKIKKKYEEGIKTGTYPKQDEIADPQLVDDANSVTATPIDRVYEHGFYPLTGSFRANVNGNYEIFDQWIEVLPTDQIVPVPVQYDPKTGRQI